MHTISQPTQLHLLLILQEPGSQVHIEKHRPPAGDLDLVAVLVLQVVLWSCHL